MKLLYVVPGPMSQRRGGPEELERRRAVLQAAAADGTQVDIADVEQGPDSIESMYEEALSVPDTVGRMVQAERDAYAGAVLGCFGDPGIFAIREMVRMPVVAPGEASMLTAAMLGHRFSIITVTDSVVPPLELLVRTVGLENRLASVRATRIPVLQLHEDEAASKTAVLAQAQKARDEDRADVVILGCMSLAFLGIGAELQERLAIPVVSPAVVSLKLLEALVSAGLSHSKRAYPVPPKYEFAL